MMTTNGKSRAKLDGVRDSYFWSVGVDASRMTLPRRMDAAALRG
jgi:hypothetical protein